MVTPGTTRAGLIALAGRPNVGKSTLVNAIVGQKVAIVSDKPQTTRRAIRGVATRDDAQLVLTDLPGVQRPLDNLTERMQRRVERELSETDVALMVLNAEQGVGPGDRWIANVLRNAPCPVVIAVNKVDRLDRPHIDRSRWRPRASWGSRTRSSRSARARAPASSRWPTTSSA